MTKVTLNNVNNLQNETTAVNTINNNSNTIVSAFDNTLSRDGSSPNQMGSDLDMNSHHILNLPAPVLPSEPVTLALFNTATTVAGNVPAGGSTGQVLAKASNTSFDDHWIDVGGSLTAGSNISIVGQTISTTATPTFTTVNTATIPTVVDTLVGRATTDTLTNKTYDTAGTGNSFSINGVVANNNTGTGSVVRATSPTLVTPVLGVATATTLNKVTLTAPASAATLTLVDGTTVTGPAATGTLVTKTSTDTLTNKTFDSAGTGNVLQVGSVTLSKGQYPGETTTGSATAGNIGEYVFSQVVLGSAVSLTTGTTTNITSISLTAGDWDVWGNISFNAAGSTTIQGLGGWISTVSAAVPTNPNNGSYTIFQATFATGGTNVIPVGQIRISLSGTTTVFLEAFPTFLVSTMTGHGFIGARRAR